MNVRATTQVLGLITIAAVLMTSTLIQSVLAGPQPACETCDADKTQTACDSCPGMAPYPAGSTYCDGNAPQPAKCNAAPGKSIVCSGNSYNCGDIRDCTTRMPTTNPPTSCNATVTGCVQTINTPCE